MGTKSWLVRLCSGILIFSGGCAGFEYRYVPSESMLPTLQANDRVAVHTLAYLSRSPQRGDIIIFNSTPEHEARGLGGEAFISRIIGLPGETIEVKAGKVYIDEQPLEESYIYEPPQYQYGPAQVPPDSYFVLGDNRNNSFGSQHWGAVPQDLIRGRAARIWWPPGRARALN